MSLLSPETPEALNGGLKLYSCPDCAYKTSSMRKLGRHRSVNHAGTRYVCQQCDFVTGYQSNFYRHRKQVHNGTAEAHRVRSGVELGISPLPSRKYNAQTVTSSQATSSGTPIIRPQPMNPTISKLTPSPFVGMAPSIPRSLLSCKDCNKDFENIYQWQIHMSLLHGADASTPIPNLNTSSIFGMPNIPNPAALMTAGMYSPQAALAAAFLSGRMGLGNMGSSNPLQSTFMNPMMAFQNNTPFGFPPNSSLMTALEMLRNAPKSTGQPPPPQKQDVSCDNCHIKFEDQKQWQEHVRCFHPEKFVTKTSVIQHTKDTVKSEFVGQSTITPPSDQVDKMFVNENICTECGDNFETVELLQSHANDEHYNSLKIVTDDRTLQSLQVNKLVSKADIGSTDIKPIEVVKCESKVFPDYDPLTPENEHVVQRSLKDNEWKFVTSATQMLSTKNPQASSRERYSGSSTSSGYHSLLSRNGSMSPLTVAPTEGHRDSMSIINEEAEAMDLSNKEGVKKQNNNGSQLISPGVDVTGGSGAKYRSEQEVIESPQELGCLKDYEKDPDVRQRTCSICGYQGKWISEMVRHKRVHTNERPFKCRYCSRTSKWKADLIRHVAKVHGVRVVSKYSRSRTFDSDSQKMRALKEAHGFLDSTAIGSSGSDSPPLLSEDDDQYIQVGYEQMDQQELQQSNGRGSLDLKRLEENAALILTNQFSLDTNTRSKSFDESFSSSGDGGNMFVAWQNTTPASKSFSEGDRLQLLATGRPVSSQSAVLQKYVMIETSANGESLLKCRICPYETRDLHTFRAHTQKHENKKPYQCSTCGYRSNWSSDVHKHIRLKKIGHETAYVVKLSPDEQKSSDQSRSPKTIGSSPDGRLSVNSVGSMKKLSNGSSILCWRCLKCPYANEARSDVISHLSRVHDLPAYACPMCNFSAMYRKTCLYHVQSVHSRYDVNIVENLVSDYLKFNQGQPVAIESSHVPLNLSKKFDNSTTDNAAAEQDGPTAAKRIRSNSAIPTPQIPEMRCPICPNFVAISPEQFNIHVILHQQALNLFSLGIRPNPPLGHDVSSESKREELSVVDVQSDLKLSPSCASTETSEMTEGKRSTSASPFDHNAPNCDEEVTKPIVVVDMINRISCGIQLDCGGCNDKQIKKVYQTSKSGVWSEWQCRYCQLTNRKLNNIKLHERKHFLTNQPGLFCCPLCSFEGNVVQMNSHKSGAQTVETEMVCEKCPSIFTDSTVLTCHLNQHNNEVNSDFFQCGDCSYASGDMVEFGDHGRVHEVTNSGQQIYCEFCPAKFKTTQKRNFHQRFHSHKGAFGCELCTYCSNDSTILTKHHHKHHGLIRPT